MASRIEDYALVGDGETAALIARDGSVDLLCWPRFDSDACFAALLGDADNGHWRIAPAGAVTRTTRRYQGDTLVLETEFATGSGAVRVIDFMPMRDTVSALVRRVEGVRGTVPMRLDCALRFDSGAMPPWLQPRGDGFLAEVGPDRVRMHAPVALQHREAAVWAEFDVAQGQRLDFVLVYDSSTAPLRDVPDVSTLLSETLEYWEAWSARFDRPTRWDAAVRRSLVTLKALIHRPTGGLVAAASLGLPEVIGGSMNWDYRYCWLRDATFTLTALLNAGFHEEAGSWRDWILRAIAGKPDRMRIMYRVDGSRRLDEYKAHWLPGYEGSRPVLVGNAASGQTQLDVYGELLDAMHVGSKAGLVRTERSIEVEVALIEYLEGIWDKPGADIWETRGEGRRYTYSQAMAWVGINAFLVGARTHGAVDETMRRRLEGVRDTIHATVCREGYDSARGHFVQAYDNRVIDASLLLLPITGFLPASDPRIAGTIAAVERELTEGGLVRRKASRGDGSDEGTFLACSCWMADAMSMQGRKADAATMLERVIGLSNDVGLLSEEYSVPQQRMLGNIPQALSHLGVVNTALGLSGPVVQRGA